MKLLEYVTVYPNLQNDIDNIQHQILDLIANGNDVQLHLHPHWIDAIYNGKKWEFKYDHFSLQTLSDDDDVSNIYGLRGCVFQSLNIMKQVIHAKYPNYRINKFRAGGYKVEPFSRIASIFKEYGIYIDSSVCSGMYNLHPISSYDFRNYPVNNKYTFDSSPMIEGEGYFIEFPIKTIKLSGVRNLYLKMLRKLKYPNLEQNRCGKGVAFSSRVLDKKSNFRKVYSNLMKSKLEMFTTDSMFPEKFKYIINQVDDYSVLILHPKLMNTVNMSVVETMLKKSLLKFHALPNS
ncbi:hypothetical protein N9251_03145 [Gammaproteobacteria bacterium]|nr:hypothetical protein [Gammaproteobacteria bacterium]